MKTHGSSKDYKCPLCRRAFLRKHTLQQHMQGHRSGNTVRQKALFSAPTVDCEICGKGFAGKGGLQRHMRKHQLGLLKTEKSKSNVYLEGNVEGICDRIEVHGKVAAGNVEKDGIIETKTVVKHGVVEKHRAVVSSSKLFAKETESNRTTRGSQPVKVLYDSSIDSFEKKFKSCRKFLPSFSKENIECNIMKERAKDCTEIDFVKVKTAKDCAPYFYEDIDNSTSDNENYDDKEKGKQDRLAEKVGVEKDFNGLEVCFDSNDEKRKDFSLNLDNISGNLHSCNVRKEDRPAPALSSKITNKPEPFKGTTTNPLKYGIQFDNGEKVHIKRNTSRHVQRRTKPLNVTYCEMKSSWVRKKCKLCARVFRSYSLLTFHVKSHRKGKTVYRYDQRKDNSLQLSSFVMCKVCNKRFKSEKQLALHKKLCRKTSSAVSDPKSKAKIYNKGVRDKCTGTEAEMNCYNCQLCEKKFKGKMTLFSHMRQTHGIEKPAICELCQQSFASISGLNKHKQKHINGTVEIVSIKSFMCNFCGLKYVTNEGLQKHIMTKHTNYAQFQCEHCKKILSQKCHLARHMKSKHSGVKESVCNICDKAFADKWALEAHMRSHYNKRPYPCSECDKKFVSSSSRNTHIQQIHRKVRFRCDYCEAEFTAKKSLNYHILRHVAENKMDEASVGYDPTFYAKVRPVKPLKPKEVECEQCGRNFTSRKGLINHKNKRCLKMKIASE